MSKDKKAGGSSWILLILDAIVVAFAGALAKEFGIGVFIIAGLIIVALMFCWSGIQAVMHRKEPPLQSLGIDGKNNDLT